MSIHPNKSAPPMPNTAYGSPDEETNRVFRKRQGVRPGTKIGIPGRSDGWPSLNKAKGK